MYLLRSCDNVDGFDLSAAGVDIADNVAVFTTEYAKGHGKNTLKFSAGKNLFL